MKWLNDPENYLLKGRRSPLQMLGHHEESPRSWIISLRQPRPTSFLDLVRKDAVIALLPSRFDENPQPSLERLRDATVLRVEAGRDGGYSTTTRGQDVDRDKSIQPNRRGHRDHSSKQNNGRERIFPAHQEPTRSFDRTYDKKRNDAQEQHSALDNQV